MEPDKGGHHRQESDGSPTSPSLKTCGGLAIGQIRAGRGAEPRRRLRKVFVPPTYSSQDRKLRRSTMSFLQSTSRGIGGLLACFPRFSKAGRGRTEVPALVD
jgi:hypothetical protein